MGKDSKERGHKGSLDKHKKKHHKDYRDSKTKRHSHQKDKGKHRDRSRSRSRHRDRDRTRDRERTRDRSREQNRDRHPRRKYSKSSSYSESVTKPKTYPSNHGSKSNLREIRAREAPSRSRDDSSMRKSYKFDSPPKEMEIMDQSTKSDWVNLDELLELIPSLQQYSIPEIRHKLQMFSVFKTYQATNTDRKLYVGNIPRDKDLTSTT